jgi:hypothetical protein
MATKRKTKKALPATTPDPEPIYRWEDATSYSQTAGHRRGEKQPTSWRLANAAARGLGTQVMGLTLLARAEPGRNDFYRVEARPDALYRGIAAESLDVAKAKALDTLRAHLLDQLALLDAVEAQLAQMKP